MPYRRDPRTDPEAVAPRVERARARVSEAERLRREAVLALAALEREAGLFEQRVEQAQSQRRRALRLALARAFPDASADEGAAALRRMEDAVRDELAREQRRAAVAGAIRDARARKLGAASEPPAAPAVVPASLLPRDAARVVAVVTDERVKRAEWVARHAAELDRAADRLARAAAEHEDALRELEAAEAIASR